MWFPRSPGSACGQASVRWLERSLLEEVSGHVSVRSVREKIAWRSLWAGLHSFYEREVYLKKSSIHRSCFEEGQQNKLKLHMKMNGDNEMQLIWTWICGTWSRTLSGETKGQDDCEWSIQNGSMRSKTSYVRDGSAKDSVEDRVRWPEWLETNGLCL